MSQEKLIGRTGDRQMAARIGNVTLDCEDVLAIARFWSVVLGRPLDPGSSPGFATIGGADPDRVVPAWYFSRVPEVKTAKNRLHVDLIDPDPCAVDRLVGLGATVVDRHDIGVHSWTVLQDPEGNEFCVATTSFTG